MRIRLRNTDVACGHERGRSATSGGRCPGSFWTDPSIEAIALPEEPTQALRFGKAHNARSVTLLEDHVELITDLLATIGEARATDIARRLGVTHPTALNVSPD